MKLTKKKMFGFGLAGLALSGVAAPYTVGLWMMGAGMAAANTPAILLAYARGESGGCNLSSYWPYLRYSQLESERIRLIRASKLIGSDEHLEQWQTPEGIFWKPKTTDLFFVLAEQKVDVYETDAHNVHKGDIVLDAGANVGTFTRKALDRGAAVVVAIEPSPDNVESLRRTFAKEEKEGRVIVLAKGVWDKEDTLKMTTFKDSALDSFVMKNRPELLATDKREIALPLTTIDHLVAELNLARVDFIKMDIEGAERNAIRGGSATIQKFHPRMSIATENLEDDYKVVPQVIREVEPKYTGSCGLCRILGSATTRPDIMFFEAN